MKGYQWPFAAGHVPGSSLIDIFLHIETAQRGRRVFLDYRTDPADFDINTLGSEAYEYLKRSGCLEGKTPIERLQKLNNPAVELYREHGIDISQNVLEIAVCAQHNNGGLAGNIWWESENIKGLFPVGEVNGSHGVTRPGGSALNAGQCGAFRAAEFIANRASEWDIDIAEAEKIAVQAESVIKERIAEKSVWDYQLERKIFQHRMSLYAAFVREKHNLKTALDEAVAQLERLQADGLSENPVESLRNEQLLYAQIVYLESIIFHVNAGVGSRGSSLVMDEKGVSVHPMLDWRMSPEDSSFRESVLCTLLKDGKCCFEWEKCRPVPDGDDWFENIWHDYRNGKIYE